MGGLDARGEAKGGRLRNQASHGCNLAINEGEMRASSGARDPYFVCRWCRRALLFGHGGVPEGQERLRDIRDGAKTSSVPRSAAK